MKLCMVTTNPSWKNIRNLYAMLLLDQVLKGKLDKPFNSLPPETPLPSISKALIVR